MHAFGGGSVTRSTQLLGEGDTSWVVSWSPPPHFSQNRALEMPPARTPPPPDPARGGAGELAGIYAPRAPSKAHGRRGAGDPLPTSRARVRVGTYMVVISFPVAFVRSP